MALNGAPRKIRVLVFDHTAVLGGGELALVEVVKRIDRSRVDMTVLLGAHGPLEELLEDHVPVRLMTMTSRVRGMARASVGLARIDGLAALVQSIAYVWRLARLLRAENYDVLHTNSLKACVLGGLAGRLAGCRVVWHIRDRIEEDYLPSRAVNLVRMAAKWLPHHVIANSAATAQTLHLRRTPCDVIYSGVDLLKFSPLERNSVSSCKRIGLIGRICPWKGQHVFIEAAAKVHSMDPDTSFHIIGAALFGESAYEHQCRELVRTHKLDQALEFAGFSGDVATVMQSLTMVVHASITGEPFGQVITQGMASGKPVVATNGGGVPEIIEDGHTGLLVPMGDADAMATAIVALLKDPANARRIGENGRRSAEKLFSVDETVRRIVNVYEAVTGRTS